MADDGRFRERGLAGGKGHKNPVKGLFKGGKKLITGRKSHNESKGRAQTPVERHMKDTLLGMGSSSDKFARHGGPGMGYYGAHVPFEVQEQLRKEEQAKQQSMRDQQRVSSSSPSPSQKPRFIRLKNGNMIKMPNSFSGGHHSDDDSMVEAMEASRATLSSDNLLREALSLRLDLEQELESNLATKEKLVRSRRRMDQEMQSLGQSEMFEKSVLEYSTRHRQLERQLKEAEVSIKPLQTAISDLRQVEKFIRDQHLGNEEAAIVFQDIMKKMFEDLNLTETPPNGIKSANSLPKNVMAELKERLESGSFGRQPSLSSSSSSDTQAWVAFGDEQQSSASAPRGPAIQRPRIGSGPNVQGAWDKLNQLKTISCKGTITSRRPQGAQGLEFPNLAASGAFKDPQLPGYHPSTTASSSSGRSSRAEGTGSIMAVDDMRQWENDPMVVQSRGTGMRTPTPGPGLFSSASVSSLSSMDNAGPSASSSFDGSRRGSQGLPQSVKPAGSWMQFGDDDDVKGNGLFTGSSQGATPSTASQPRAMQKPGTAMPSPATAQGVAGPVKPGSDGLSNVATFEVDFPPVPTASGRQGAGASAAAAAGFEAEWDAFSELAGSPVRGRSTGSRGQSMGGMSDYSQTGGDAEPVAPTGTVSGVVDSAVKGPDSGSSASKEPAVGDAVEQAQLADATVAQGEQILPKSNQLRIEGTEMQVEEGADEEQEESTSSMASALKLVKLKKNAAGAESLSGGDEMQPAFDIGNMDIDTIVSAMGGGDAKQGAPPPPPPPPGKKGGKAPVPPPPPGGRRAKGDSDVKRQPQVIEMFQEVRRALLSNAQREKVQDRMDILNRTKEADEARFKSHDVPWNKKLMTEVKHASLHAMDLYMQIALDEANETMESSLADKKKRDKALAVLTAFPAAKSLNLPLGLTPGHPEVVLPGVDPFTKKDWYDVKAPSVFKVRNVGKTLVTRTQGTKIASEGLKGRVFEVSLADLQENEDNSYRKFRLRVEDVQGKNCLTNFWGMNFTTDKLRSLVRKWQSLIEAVVEVKTTDGYTLRVFCIGFTKKHRHQVKKTCYAQSSQVRQIRKKMVEIITRDASSCDLKTLVTHFIPEAFGTTIEKECKGTYPLQNVFIRKAKIVKAPKFDLTKLMEVHGDYGEEAGTAVPRLEGEEEATETPGGDWGDS
eukprot:evm.model.scf_1017.5 EVM.evm.TU.scf_1017.5   scf_1017:34794-47123(+)